MNLSEAGKQGKQALYMKQASKHFTWRARPEPRAKSQEPRAERETFV